MKTSIVSLALAVMLASPLAGYASNNSYGQVHKHRATYHATLASWRDPFKPRTTSGLSRNRNACASYGCVGAGCGGA
jgi:hypothetical protein